jgi:maltose/maltodextrin transport system substrate-binding protein
LRHSPPVTGVKPSSRSSGLRFAPLWEWLVLAILVSSSAECAFGWNDGELLIWMSRGKGEHAVAELGSKFEKDQRISVKVESYVNLTDRFEAAARKDKGPDIVLWAHDRIGEWAEAG